MHILFKVKKVFYVIAIFYFCNNYVKKISNEQYSENFVRRTDFIIKILINDCLKAPHEPLLYRENKHVCN